MTKGPIEGIKYLHNGQVREVPGFDPDKSTPMYYEVVRLINGQFLFLDDHLSRLRHSLEGSGLIYPGNKALLENLGILLRENSIRNGNIRICIQEKKSASNLLCYFIPYHYPKPSDYREGIKLITYSHERPLPGIKLWDDRFRTEVKQTIQEKQVYEALLLNRKGEVTEGSRSNIFFIDKRGSLLTPPEKKVLPGITRKYVLRCAMDAGMEVREELLDLQSALSMPGCFISGTSPKVLPVNRIDEHPFSADHPAIRELMDRFEEQLKLNLKTII